MGKTFRSFFVAVCGVWASTGLLPGADLKHDLYLCTNLSGQSQVMGSGRVAVASGVYRSSDRETFTHVGPGHIRVFTLTGDLVDRGTIWLAVLDGVVRSRDRGVTWRTMTGWNMTEPRAIAFDPHAPDHGYVGLPDGIAVSTDHGQTWQRMNEGIRRSYTETITVDRTKAGRVLAGTEKGIYLTEDGAKTWKMVQATDKTTYDLLQSPHDPKAFFAVTSSDGAFQSTDAGRSWQKVAGVPTAHTLHACDYDAVEARRIVLCGWGVGVMLSEDGGRSWSDRTTGLPNREIWTVAFDPDIPGRIYAAPHLSPLHVSDDLGRTWRPLTFEKAIIYDLVFVPRP
jgi:hypothetical protein